jgi:F-type H+-transporting ATPase subunit a
MDHGASHIGAHKLGHFAGLTFNMDTLYMTWLTMAIVLLIAFLATRSLAVVPKSRWQNFIELVVVGLLDQIESSIGPKGKKVAPLLITLFLFLLVANWLGLVPGFTSPTNDINTTLGLAVMVASLSHILGMVNKGVFPYLSHFFQPNILFFPINVIEEIAKPITLAARLFGNILAGEILIIILGILVPYVIPTAWLAFSVFVGMVQALIFTIMSLSYLSNALKDDHH